MKQRIILQYMAITTIVVCSASSYCYMNRQAELLTSQKEQQTSLAINHNNTNHTKIESKSSLPDVELLKFIIQKGKDGIPVIKFRDFLNW